jgi:hypothetical protein
MSHNPFWDPNLVYSVVIDNDTLKTLANAMAVCSFA